MTAVDLLLGALALGVGVLLAWNSRPIAKALLFSSAMLVAALLFLPGQQLTSIASDAAMRWATKMAAYTPWAVSDWIHFVLFAWLGVLLWLGRPDLRGWKVWGAIGVLAVAAELAQWLAPEREVWLEDVLLNLAGGVTGLLFGIALDAAQGFFKAQTRK